MVLLHSLFGGRDKKGLGIVRLPLSIKKTSDVKEMIEEEEECCRLEQILGSLVSIEDMFSSCLSS